MTEQQSQVNSESGSRIVAEIERLGVTHVLYLPDAVIGQWEGAFTCSTAFDLIRICREGEAWPLAMGLHLGGAKPLVVIQSTGWFESGDSMRNVLFDLNCPVYAIVGYRSFLVEDSDDSARRFMQPLVDAWQIDHIVLKPEDDVRDFGRHFEACQSSLKPGICMLAEGKN